MELTNEDLYERLGCPVVEVAVDAKSELLARGFSHDEVSALIATYGVMANH